MLSKIQTLHAKDENGEEYLIFPKTLTKSVTNENGETLENILNQFLSGDLTVGNAHSLDNFSIKEIGESGARNLLSYPFYETTHEHDGIIWTDNGDGSVTANGTASDESVFYLKNKFVLPAGTYSLSGCPSGGGSSRYSIQLSNNAWDQYIADFGSGKTITITEEVNFAQFRCRVGSGVTVENLTFKPMLVIGSVPQTYTPYYVGGAEDAKTLGGHGAEYFVNMGEGLGTSITEKALTLANGVHFYQLGGSYYTGNDLPTSNYAWSFSNAMVLKRNNGSLEIVLFSEKVGRTAIRSYDGSWNEWSEYATTADLANYLPLRGGGTVEGSGMSPLTIRSWASSAYLNFENITEEIVGALGFSGVDTPVFVNSAYNRVYQLLHTGNMANHVLPLTGATHTGEFTVTSHAKNGRSSILKNSSDEYDFGTLFVDCSADGKLARIEVSALNNTVKFIDNASKEFSLLHTGNKPSGSYTGNGDATERTIQIGGIGRALFITGNGCSVIITNTGAFGVSSEGIVINIPRSECWFDNGCLCLSTSGVLNAVTNYLYQVL